MDPNRLRLLDLAEPLGPQLAHRRSVVWVASAILTGLIGFILAIFASFGRPDLGLLVGGVLFGLPLGWIWWDHRQFGRAVARYQRTIGTPINDEPPA